MLHESIKAAVEQRLAVAQAATPGPWMWIAGRVMQERGRVVISDADGLATAEPEDLAFIAANDPARIIRDCRRDLKVLARHQPYEYAPAEPDPYGGPDSPLLTACHWCLDYYDQYPMYPCDEIRDLAEAYDIPTGDSP
jgi:hypothetical protein